MKYIAMGLIRVYQKTLSFDHGLLKFMYPNGYCRFTPTCSEYTYQAIEKYGIVKGVWLGSKRVARCNPWHEPGFDPIPSK